MKARVLIPFLFLFCPLCGAADSYVKHWNKGRGYIPFHHITPDGILLDNRSETPLLDSIEVSLPPEISAATDLNFKLSFRIDNRHAHPSRRYAYRDLSGKDHYRKNPSWGFFLTGDDGRRCWITVGKEPEEPSSYSDATLPGTQVVISIDSLPDTRPESKPVSEADSEADSKINSKTEDDLISTITGATVKEALLPFSGESLWHIEYKDRSLNIMAGSHGISRIISAPLDFDNLTSFGFAASPAAEVLVSDISLTVSSALPMKASVSVSDLASILERSEDQLEGYWEVFDRTLDEALLKLGGDYKLAIVKSRDADCTPSHSDATLIPPVINQDVAEQQATSIHQNVTDKYGVRHNERYEIIYLGGARTNGSVWQPGMLKGILAPSSFPGLFNLEWIDSEGEHLSNSITAQTGYNSTLTLQFPYHSSVIRLRKVNPPTD